jgi:uncharacterized protein (DUF169 family)
MTMVEELTLDPQDLPILAELLQRDLDMPGTPVAIRYRDQPASDTESYGRRAPSVCTFFAEARDRTFQASADDHADCEIGAYVHGIAPTGELGRRLNRTVSWMEQEHYLAPGEAALIPHNPVAPAHAVYGPLTQSRDLPTAVLLFVRPKGLMLVTEAAREAWPERGSPPLLTRPMCSILPVLNSGVPVAISVGCTGSRLYTQMGEDQVLAAVRGDALLPFADAVHRVRQANDRVWAHDQEALAMFQARPSG